MAHELFTRIADILSAPAEAQPRIMHEALVIACHEGLKETRHGFGNLSSQVEPLCRQHNIAPQDIVAIQQMRPTTWLTTAVPSLSSSLPSYRSRFPRSLSAGYRNTDA